MSAESGWLKKAQQAALNKFEQLSLPTGDDEVWRYSNIDELDLKSYSVISDFSVVQELEKKSVGNQGKDGSPAKNLKAELEKEYGELAGLLVSQCGYFVDSYFDDSYFAGDAANVYAGTLNGLNEHNQKHSGKDNENSAALNVYGKITSDLKAQLGGLRAKAIDDYFHVMNTVNMDDPLVIHIPASTVLEKPIGILELSDLGGAMSFPRLIIDVGQNASASVLHVSKSHNSKSNNDLETNDDVHSNFVAPVVDLSVGEAANLSYLNVEDLGFSTHQISSIRATVSKQANLAINTVSLGGASARLRTDCRLEGRGASGNILSLYFATGTQQFDFRTFQKHVEPDTQSNLLFKGAVDDQAGLVYSGMVRILPGAKSSDAVQANHNLKLSEDAWVESVPNLEIENNDVTCSHATTVGPVDEDQQFYLESRGIPTDIAEELIVAGFFKEALKQISMESARDTLFNRLISRFASQGGN